MLELVKLALRIKNDVFDDEISGLIDTAVADLVAAGVDASDDSENARVKQAIVLYCKAFFGVDNPSAQRFSDAYELLRIALALDGDMRVE
jgi:hypothetical protein